MSKHWVILLFPILLLLHGCGGDEEAKEESEDEDQSSDASKTEDGVESGDNTAESSSEESEEPEPEPPDPNGVYVALDEKLNGQPVYTTESKDNKGYFLWFDGSKWKVSDQKGGGTIVSTSSDKQINTDWTQGNIRSHPDQDFLKDATHYLAITYQGTSDFDNARRMFKDFLKKYPDDPKAAEANLCLGDIVTSSLEPEQQPTFEQIDLSREYYQKARSLAPADPKIVNDSTFNEGDLLEVVADNPEGITEEMLAAADKDNNDVLSRPEYSSQKLLRGVSFDKANRNKDDKVDYGELFAALSLIHYQEMSELFEKYKKTNKDLEGAELSRATHKIGLAYEKQELPGKMLQEYAADIEEFGNVASSVGTDEILKIYREKYDFYNDKYKHTIALLDAIDRPSSKVKETLGDRRKLIPWLDKEFPGVDVEVRNHVVNLRTAIKNESDKQRDWIALKKSEFKELDSQFDPNGSLAPKTKFNKLFNTAQSSGQRTLALRMRWILDEIGAGIKDGYLPKSGDFGDASPSVLLWMGRVAELNSDSGTARKALRNLVNNYAESGGFVFDALIELGDIEFKNRKYAVAESFYVQAYVNFSYHPRAFEAQIKLGNARLLLGQTNNDSDKLIEAEQTFDEVMQNDQLTVAVRKVRPADVALNSQLKVGHDITTFPRAEALYKMGQCRDAQREYVQATDYYRQVYNGFPSAKQWVRASFKAASDCFDKLGDADAAANLRSKRKAWENKFDAN